jgi:hypothetical protein
VIAQGDVPRNLQGWRVVNGFERLLPVRVIQGCDATLVEIVPHGDNKSRLVTLTGDSHLPRNLPLMWASLAPPVANDRKSQSRLVIAREIADEFPSR